MTLKKRLGIFREYTHKYSHINNDMFDDAEIFADLIHISTPKPLLFYKDEEDLCIKWESLNSLLVCVFKGNGLLEYSITLEGYPLINNNTYSLNRLPEDIKTFLERIT